MAASASASSPSPLRLLFARHGATAPNLAGLRCGGDLDPPLAEEGRRQAIELARRVAARRPRIELILCSDLLRVRETAAIVRAALGPVALHVLPGFRERYLGSWNLQSIDDTQDELAAGATPPGGESVAEFGARIERALQGAAPLLLRPVLLVGSKGVGRVLRERAGLPPLPPLKNAELLELSFGDLHRPRPQPQPIGTPA
ncbi:MAG: histidine phosphatase family protein [Rubrivivax sp.]